MTNEPAVALPGYPLGPSQMAGNGLQVWLKERRTIAFVSQKGGCGKSTLAACLAVAAQEAGERVFVLDMDPKKSLVRWGSKRNDSHLPVEVVPSARLKAALTTLAKRNISLVIVDTPALESPRSLAAIKAADLCIVPARPATFDIWASEVTGRKLKLMGKDFVFLLNQCPPVREASCVQNGIAALERIGTLLRPHIRAHAGFLEAVHTGKGVTEVDPKGQAANDMRDLFMDLNRRLRG
ncbi:MAG: ParA family protein [Pseudomonadota bacterium]|nr:ParA family protein [Pseudomonadota bacterium]